MRAQGMAVSVPKERLPPTANRNAAAIAIALLNPLRLVPANARSLAVAATCSQDFHRTLRQPVHKGAAVWFRHDAVIQNYDETVIVLRPD